jgi:alanyl-tRNA synthetase
MTATERLYFTDSSLLEFSATVVEVRPGGTGELIVLDRTAFYPTGGGQPNDTGKLGGVEVLDVIEAEDGAILHAMKESGRIKAGQAVEGQVDRARRLDYLQQHSGQHILTQAFIQVCGADTKSLHLGAHTSTIDIYLQSPTDEHMRAAEEIANAIIFEDRPMRIHLVSEQEAAQLPLRKDSAIQGTIRVIEVEGFDWSPCCGTHAVRTGQVGLIAIKSFERAKKMTRVEFVCGRRALLDYRHANNTAAAIARLLSAERDSAPEMVARMMQENKSLKKRQRDLLELAMTAEAAEMLAQASRHGAFKIIRATWEARDPEELRVLASKIVGKEPAVALLGTRDASMARLVFARSESITQNMGQLLAESCQLLGGRGGGRPDIAQGGGPDAQKLDEAINLAVEKVAAEAGA